MTPKWARRRHKKKTPKPPTRLRGFLQKIGDRLIVWIRMIRRFAFRKAAVVGREAAEPPPDGSTLPLRSVVRSEVEGAIGWWRAVCARVRTFTHSPPRRLVVAGVLLALGAVVWMMWPAEQPPALLTPEARELDFRTRVQKISGLISSKNLRQAEKQIEAFQELHPDHPALFTLRGALKTQRKEFAAARIDYEKAVELSSGSYSSLFNLAELDFLTGDLPRARERFQGLLAERPEDERLLFRLYLCALIEGRSQEEAELYLTLSNREASPIAYYVPAARHFQEKRRSEGRRLVQTAQVLFPDTTGFYDATFEALGFR
jgi:uncharacterized protein HemY